MRTVSTLYPVTYDTLALMTTTILFFIVIQTIVLFSILSMVHSAVQELKRVRHFIGIVSRGTPSTTLTDPKQVDFTYTSDGNTPTA